MKAILVIPFRSLSGTDRSPGGLNYYPLKGEQIIRVKPSGGVKNTGEQISARVAWRTAGEWWLTLTFDQGEDWKRWAVKRNMEAGEGDRALTGVSAFSEVNYYRAIDGQSIQVDAPKERSTVYQTRDPFLYEDGDPYVGRLSLNRFRINEGYFYARVGGGFETPNRQARSTEMRSWSYLEGQDAVEPSGGGSLLNWIGDHPGWALIVGRYYGVWIRHLSNDWWPGKWSKFHVICQA